MIKAGIISGSGYVAGELIRLLIHHPDVELSFVQSESNAGQRIDSMHPGLTGDTGLTFINTAPLDQADIVFLCKPHGHSREYLSSVTIPAGLKIIDLSIDHRMASDDHDFVYGLPELNRKAMVRGAMHIANPGCYATAIELSLLPLAKNLLLNSDIHVTAIGGSSGLGAIHRETNHYSWRHDNVAPYRVLSHQHIPEIRQTLTALQSSFNTDINFIPIHGPFPRGIMAVSYLDTTMELDMLKHLYEQAYEDHSFTHIVDRTPDLHDAVNTNKCLIHLEKNGSKLIITTVIDNLLKGAAGTAVHNMNLMFGLHETVGLQLKTSAF